MCKSAINFSRSFFFPFGFLGGFLLFICPLTRLKLNQTLSKRDLPYLVLYRGNKFPVHYGITFTGGIPTFKEKRRGKKVFLSFLVIRVSFFPSSFLGHRSVFDAISGKKGGELCFLKFFRGGFSPSFSDAISVQISLVEVSSIYQAEIEMRVRIFSSRYVLLISAKKEFQPLNGKLYTHHFSKLGSCFPVSPVMSVHVRRLAFCCTPLSRGHVNNYRQNSKSPPPLPLSSREF